MILWTPGRSINLFQPNSFRGIVYSQRNINLNKVRIGKSIQIWPFSSTVENWKSTGTLVIIVRIYINNINSGQILCKFIMQIVASDRIYVCIMQFIIMNNYQNLHYPFHYIYNCIILFIIIHNCIILFIIIYNCIILCINIHNWNILVIMI